jgi:terminase, large subunit
VNASTVYAISGGNAILSKFPRPEEYDIPIIISPSSLRKALRIRDIDPATSLPIKPSAWVSRYRRLPFQGDSIAWDHTRSPYAVYPMDYWDRPSVREVYLRFAPQIVKTEIAFNLLFFAAHQKPSTMMFATSDEALAGRAMNRINDSIRVSPSMMSLVGRPDDLTKSGFRLANGSSLFVAWTTSLSRLASDPAEYVFADEASKYSDYSGSSEKKEASPFDLIRQRQNSYPYTKKLLALSSPSPAPCLISRLDRHEADESFRLEVSCPICGAPQIMLDDNIVVLRNITDPRTIRRERLGRYACASCGMFWDDYLRNRAVAGCRWVPGQYDEEGDWHRSEPLANPVAGSFHLPSWYNVAMSLSEIAARRIQGEDDPHKRMVYVTQDKAEEYKETIDPKRDSHILKLRTSLRSGVVPANAVALTAGFDSHTWGYRFTIYAWTEDEHGFDGDKIMHGQVGSLAAVKQIIFDARFPVEDSLETLSIWRASIDTGGSKGSNSDKSITEEVYNWLRDINLAAERGFLPAGVVFGVKGASGPQLKRVRPSKIDHLPGAKVPIPGGLELHIIDTQQFKVMLHMRISPRDGSPPRIHFDSETGEDFARELLSEELRIKPRGGHEWVKVRTANHYLDSTVYAMACADGEFQPSLKIQAPMIRELRSGVAPQPKQRRVLSRGLEDEI